jgi:hypothetical protein
MQRFGAKGAPDTIRKDIGNHMRFFRIIAGIVLVFVLVGLAGGIFQAGYFAGAAGGGTVVAGPWYGFAPFGWGFGGGFFGFLGSLFILFLIFGLLRAAFGGGHRGSWGGGPRRGWYDGDHRHGQGFGPWEGRAREIHDEWHRRTSEPGSGPTTSGGPETPSSPSTSNQA